MEAIVQDNWRCGSTSERTGELPQAYWIASVTLAWLVAPPPTVAVTGCSSGCGSGAVSVAPSVACSRPAASTHYKPDFPLKKQIPKLWWKLVRCGSCGDGLPKAVYLCRPDFGY